MKPSSPISITTSSLARKTRLSPYLFSLLAFILFVSVLYGKDFMCIFGQLEPNFVLPPSRIPENNKKEEKIAFAIGKTEERCDLFSGKWVRDEISRPPYEELGVSVHSTPAYVSRTRPSRQILPILAVATQPLRSPHVISLSFSPLFPLFHVFTLFYRFNATLMLETMRGKRMMYVGDSLNRGMFVSMIFLLHRLIPDDQKSIKTSGSLTVFTAKEYNATIEFYWAPFLLESNSDDAIVHRISDRVVSKGSINKHGRHWKGVDIIVFNTYLWWMTGLKMNILQGSFEDKEKAIVEVSTEDAYRMGLKSMLRWVKNNMDCKKTRVFFTSMSPTHAKSIDWGGEPG